MCVQYNIHIYIYAHRHVIYLYELIFLFMHDIYIAYSEPHDIPMISLGA